MTPDVYDFVIGQHDRLPALQVTLTGTDATTGVDGPVNLSTATEVRLIMRGAAGPAAVSAPMVIDPDQVAHKGRCTYHWQTADTATAGAYNVQFQVTWGDGTPQTFPMGPTGPAYKRILVQAELDA